MPESTTRAHASEAALQRHRLAVLWDALESFGAVAHRRPVADLTDDELAALIAGETERVRVLQSPEARRHVMAARIAYRKRAA